jgi:hypothetical protein
LGIIKGAIKIEIKRFASFKKKDKKEQELYFIYEIKQLEDRIITIGSYKRSEDENKLKKEMFFKKTKNFMKFMNIV